MDICLLQITHASRGRRDLSWFCDIRLAGGQRKPSSACVTHTHRILVDMREMWMIRCTREGTTQIHELVRPLVDHPIAYSLYKALLEFLEPTRGTFF